MTSLENPSAAAAAAAAAAAYYEESVSTTSSTTTPTTTSAAGTSNANQYYQDSPTSTYTYDVDQEYHQQAPGYDQQTQQQQQAQQPQQQGGGIVDGAEEEDGAATEQPFYVNAKQYHRILKRRIARAKLEENLKIARTRKPYLHESRHKHAMRRPRGQGGRFLTAAEIAELEKSKKEQQENESGIKLNDHDEEGDKSSSRNGNGKENGTGDVSGNLSEVGKDGSKDTAEPTETKLKSEPGLTVDAV